MSLTNDELEALLRSPSRLRTLTDAELMDALCSGCNDALAILFDRHRALVLQIARAGVSNHDEAEETVQRVFLEVFRASRQFNPGLGSFKTWLLKCAEPGRRRSLA
jgi:DNA-directed RNA polymerase specialized sigma24 family protein